MKAIVITIILSMVLLQVPANAKVNTKLQEFFQREIQKMSQATVSSENSLVSGIGGRDDSEMWFLNKFRLHFKASMGFEVDGLTKLLVQPEVELLFLRYPAQEWTSYRP